MVICRLAHIKQKTLFGIDFAKTIPYDPKIFVLCGYLILEKREVLILSFSHPQGVVENFVNQIALAFGCQNFDVQHLVLGHELPPQFSKINPSKINMVFSIGPLPLSLNINDRPIFEFFRCPIVMYCIDNVIKKTIQSILWIRASRTMFIAINNITPTIVHSSKILLF